jgi:serine/threonine protein kinase/tetratricopeptide (TPR) repeat protein
MPTVARFQPVEFGDYLLVSRLGRGGMAEVFKARARGAAGFERVVCVKRILRRHAEDSSLVTMMINEAKIAAQLSHPNIAQVYDLGVVDGEPFIALEFVDGRDLISVLRASAADGAPPAPVAAFIVRDTLRALAHAHEHAGTDGAPHPIVHRDVSPHNLMLSWDGVVKLVDFGIAKATQTKPTDEVTHTGTLKGKYAYMAPEQLEGRASPASDVFAAGIILHEMLTGRRLFKGTNDPDTIARVRTKPIAPPSTENPKVPPELDRIAMLMLSREEGARPSAAEAAHALEKFVGQSGFTVDDLRGYLRNVFPNHETVPDGVTITGSELEPGDPDAPTTAGRPQAKAKQRWRRRFLVAAAGIALIGVAAGATVFVRRALVSHPKPAETPGKRSIAVLGFKNLSSRPDAAWLSTALAELLATELAAGEKVRPLPGENVAHMKSDLQLSDEDGYAPETLAKIRSNLGADLVLVGSYLALGENSGGKLRIDLRLQDAATGETLATVSDTGTEAELLDLVARSGEKLRGVLGVGKVSVEEAGSVRRALPNRPAAARPYAEGLARLRAFEAVAARELFERAVAAEPDHALSHAALAASFAALGYDRRAADEAQRAFDLSTGLSRLDRAEIEGLCKSTSRKWDEAIALYQSLAPGDLENGLHLAHAQIEAARTKEALATVAQLRALPEPARGDPRIDLVEGEAAYKLADFHHALTAATGAVASAKARGARLLFARARWHECMALEKLGEHERGLSACDEAEQLFSAAGDRGSAARALRTKGTILVAEGKSADAAQVIDRALAIAREIGDRSTTADALLARANIAFALDKQADAYRDFSEAAAIYRDSGDRNGLAIALQNMEASAIQLGRTEESRHLADEALALFRETGNRDGLVIALNNRGDEARRRGLLDAAQKDVDEALRIARETGNQPQVTFVLTSVGDVALDHGDLDAARKAYEQALANQEARGEAADAATSRMWLGRIEFLDGNLAPSEEKLRKAAAEFEHGGQKELLTWCRALLAETLLAARRVDEAGKLAELARPGLASTVIEVRMVVGLALGKSAQLRNQPAAAKSLLETVLAQAQKAPFYRYELAARRALADGDLATGHRADARKKLDSLAHDAAEHGFALEARQSAALRDRLH